MPSYRKQRLALTLILLLLSCLGYAQQQVIESIEQGKISFFVTSTGVKHRVVVADNKGMKFIKSEADKLKPEMLTALPECP